jgi:hypothetical protein
MMRRALMVGGWATLFAAVLQPAVTGQTPSATSGAGASQPFTARQPQSRTTPYDTLFQVPGQPRPTRDPLPDWWRTTAPFAAPGTVPERPALVCGMTVIPADPAIDPKMRREPAPDGTRYTLRTIEPPICR